MRTILFLLLAACGGAAWAQVNLNLPKAAANAKTIITSDSGTFDNNTRQLIYLGHVVVLDPRITLYCHRLLVIVPKKGERLSHLIAETNVVIDFVDPEKHETNHLTANIAIYNYKVVNSVTNETITFTGTPGNSPQVVTAQGIIHSEPLIWDRAANKFIFTNYSMELQQSIAGTNNNSPINFLK